MFTGERTASLTHTRGPENWKRYHFLVRGWPRDDFSVISFSMTTVNNSIQKSF